MNLQILNFWRVWENFEGGLDNIVRWYDGTGNMFRDDPENMLSRDFYDFNQVWRIQTPISSAICKKIKKNRRPSQYVFILQLEFLQFINRSGNIQGMFLELVKYVQQKIFPVFDNVCYFYSMRLLIKFSRNLFPTMAFWEQTKTGQKIAAGWAGLAVLVGSSKSHYEIPISSIFLQSPH